MRPEQFGDYGVASGPGTQGWCRGGKLNPEMHDSYKKEGEG